MEGYGLNGLELRSRISEDGVLELSLQEATVPEPAADEIIVRVEATPINPSDIGVLLGPAALDAAEFAGYGSTAGGARPGAGGSAVDHHRAAGCLASRGQ